MRKFLLRFAVILLFIILMVVAFNLWVYYEDAKFLGEDQYMTNEKYAAVINAPYIYCRYTEFIEKNKNTEYHTEYRVINNVPRIELMGDGITYTFYPYVYSYNLLGKEAVDRDTDNYRLVTIVITNDSYRFGKKKIGVGSTRAEVEKAYRNNMECYEREGMGRGYIDGSWLYVRFLYDEEDKVTQISLFDKS